MDQGARPSNAGTITEKCAYNARKNPQTVEEAQTKVTSKEGIGTACSKNHRAIHRCGKHKHRLQATLANH